MDQGNKRLCKYSLAAGLDLFSFYKQILKNKLYYKQNGMNIKVEFFLVLFAKNLEKRSSPLLGQIVQPLSLTYVNKNSQEKDL